MSPSSTPLMALDWSLSLVASVAPASAGDLAPASSLCSARACEARLAHHCRPQSLPTPMFLMLLLPLFGTALGFLLFDQLSEKLSEMMALKPTVLHLVCHADFDVRKLTLGAPQHGRCVQWGPPSLTIPSRRALWAI